MKFNKVYIHHSKQDSEGNSETVQKNEDPTHIDVWVSEETEEYGIRDSISEHSFMLENWDYDQCYQAARDKAKTLSKAYEAEIEEY